MDAEALATMITILVAVLGSAALTIGTMLRQTNHLDTKFTRAFEDLSGEVKGNGERLTRLEEQGKRQSAVVDDNSRRLDELSVEVAGNGRRLDELCGEVKANSRRLDELSVEVAGHGRRLDELSVEVAGNGRRLDALCGEVRANGRRLDGLSVEVAGNGRRLDGLIVEVKGNGRRLDEQGESAKERGRVLVEVRERVARMEGYLMAPGGFTVHPASRPHEDDRQADDPGVGLRAELEAG